MPPDLNRQYGHDVDNDRRSLTLHDVHQAPAPTLSQNVVSRLYRRALRESAQRRASVLGPRPAGQRRRALSGHAARG